MALDQTMKAVETQGPASRNHGHRGETDRGTKFDEGSRAMVDADGALSGERWDTRVGMLDLSSYFTASSNVEHGSGRNGYRSSRTEGVRALNLGSSKAVGVRASSERRRVDGSSTEFAVILQDHWLGSARIMERDSTWVKTPCTNYDETVREQW